MQRHYLLPLSIALVLLWLSVLASGQAAVPVTLIGATNIASQLFFNDLLLAYQLQVPSVTVTQPTSTGSKTTLLFADQADFVISSNQLTAVQTSLYPNIQSFPFSAAALVPTYRLDALGTTSTAPAVIFSMNVLAQIYMGNITMWNDPQLVLINPTITLPAKNITVVYQSDSSAITTVFLAGMCAANAVFCTVLPASTSPHWPLSKYTRYIGGSGATGVASLVVTVDGSIGFSTLAAALQLQSNVGQFINLAGRVVTASSSSVTFAVAEMGTNIPAAGASWNLINPSGVSAWPLSIVSSVLIDMVNTRDTCEVRRALVAFWLFVYQSPVAARLATARQFAMLPDIVLTNLNIVNNILNGVLCDGVPAVTSTALTQITVSGSSRLAFMSGLLVSLYGLNDPTVDYVFVSESSQVAFDQLVAGETDVALFFETEVTAASLAAAQAQDEFLIMPAFLVSIVPIFNPQITATVNIGTTPLIIDLSTWARILLLNITQWTDYRILENNPSLATLLVNDSAPITIVTGCSSTVWLLQMYGWIYEYSAAVGDVEILTLFEKVVSNATVLADYAACIPLTSESRLAPEESSVEPIMNAITGAIGYRQDNIVSLSGEFQLIVPRMINGEIQSGITSSDPAGQLSCAMDTFDSGSLALNLVKSQRLDCWPFSTPAYIAVRTSYAGASLSSHTACYNGYKALNFVSWIYTNSGLTTTTNSQDIARVAVLSNIQNAIVNALNQVTCDGQTLLITLPSMWSLSSGAVGFGYAIAIIGLTAITAAIIIVFLYRTHPVMKSASPWFMLTSLIGIALMFIGIIFLVEDATDSSCQAVGWTVNLGFMLTFAPLFAKTWRIYRIFAKKKLSVIKLSDRKLILMVIVLLLIELIILIAWSSSSPLQPVTTTVVTANDNLTGVGGQSLTSGIINEYIQCSVQGTGSSFLILIACTKGCLLLYGALLAFSTRRVSDSFNESKAIALAIYNVVFSIAIVASILILINAVGDVRTLLIMFVILWICFFTAGLLIVPKLLKIFAPSSAIDELHSSGAKSSVDGFEFVSVENFTSPQLIKQYISALTSQLNYAKQRLLTLTKRGSNAEEQSKSIPLVSVNDPTVAMEKVNVTPQNNRRIAPAERSANHHPAGRSSVSAVLPLPRSSISGIAPAPSPSPSATSNNDTVGLLNAVVSTDMHR